MGGKGSRVKIGFFNTTRKETRGHIYVSEQKIAQNTSWEAIQRYFPEWQETDEIVVLIGHPISRGYKWKGYVLKDPIGQRYKVHITDINISVIDSNTQLVSIYHLAGFSQL